MKNEMNDDRYDFGPDEDVVPHDDPEFDAWIQESGAEAERAECDTASRDVGGDSGGTQDRRRHSAPSHAMDHDIGDRRGIAGWRRDRSCRAPKTRWRKRSGCRGPRDAVGRERPIAPLPHGCRADADTGRSAAHGVSHRVASPSRVPWGRSSWEPGDGKSSAARAFSSTHPPETTRSSARSSTISSSCSCRSSNCQALSSTRPTAR